MGYKKIPEIPRSERTYWSPEAGGRTRQRVAGKWVAKFAYSPYTAKAYKTYTFYADIKLKKEVESLASKKRFQTMTIRASVDTFIEFKKGVFSGEVQTRLDEIVGLVSGEIESISYWRGREERSESTE